MAFAPIFQRPFSATFDRRAAAAAAASWWLEGGVAAANAIAVYQPKGAASLAASYDNIAAPGNGLADGTYDAAPGVEPAWDATNGWTFNGSTQYLATGIVPAMDQSWTMLIAFTDLANLLGTLAGTYSDIAPNNAAFMVQRHSATNAMRCLNGSYSVFSNNVPGLAAGVYGMAGKTPYRNGSAETNAIATGVAPGAFLAGISIGALQYNAASRVQFANFKAKAAAIYNTTLTAPQVAAISTAMSLL